MSVSIPNEPRFFHDILSSVIKIKILQTLILLIEEIEKKPVENSNPPFVPYLSLISKRSDLNKRTTMMNLDDLERNGYVKSNHEIHEINGVPKLLKVYKFNPKVDLNWIKDIKL